MSEFPLGLINQTKTAQLYANKMRSDIMQKGYFIREYRAPSRWQKIKNRLSNYRERLHRAWLVLAHDYDLAGDE
jgi:hypothetical protein